VWKKEKLIHSVTVDSVTKQTFTKISKASSLPLPFHSSLDFPVSLFPSVSLASLAQLAVRWASNLQVGPSIL
jgi:hypothetical protein